MDEPMSFGEMLSDDEVLGLFGGSTEQEENQEKDKPEEPKDSPEEPKNPKDENDTAENLDPDEIFGSESVGSEENNEDKEDTSSKEGGSSPNFFSSMATAFAEEGIFPDLDNDTISKIETAEDFGKAVREQINAQLTDVQKRVNEVLESDFTDETKQRTGEFERTLKLLDDLGNSIETEGDQGDDIRRRVIFQDYINRGYSQERAKKEVDRAFERGTEVEDAKDALQSNKEYYTNEYQKFRNELKANADREVKEREQKAARLKKSILEDNLKFFDGLDIEKKTRQAAFDAISKPIYKDPKTGQLYTAVQKMQLDNDEQYQAIIGLCYALTDGFKSIEGLVHKKATKEVKKGFAQLEKTFANSSRDAKGNLRFTSGVDDSQSYLGKGVKLDI